MFEALVNLIKTLVDLFEALVDLIETTIDLAAEIVKPPVCPFLNHCLHDDCRLEGNLLSVKR